MKKYIYIFIIFLSIIKESILFAQDIHYSQWYNSILNLNSASTGFINDGDFRFSGNLKNQWQSIPVPYNSTTITAEKKVILQSLRKDFMGMGATMNFDQSGDARFKTFQFNFNAAFHKSISEDSSAFLSFGIQPGLVSKSLNYNRLTFDNQYRGDNFDPSFSNGESFPTEQLSYFDFGSGIGLTKKITNRNIFSIGLSASHLNKPKQSFFNNSGVRLDRKIVGNIRYSFKVHDKIDLISHLLYAQQGEYKELIPGLRSRYYLTPVNGFSTALYLGILLRNKDALIATTGMDYYNFHVELSYDVNFSGLIPASNYRGGFELSVIYIFKKLRPFVAKKRVCPIYM